MQEIIDERSTEIEKVSCNKMKYLIEFDALLFFSIRFTKDLWKLMIYSMIYRK